MVQLFNEFFLKLLFYLILFLNLQNLSYAENGIKFVNIDLLVNETKIGNQMLDKIRSLDQENIKELKSFEKEIKDTQDGIKLKKNLFQN